MPTPTPEDKRNSVNIHVVIGSQVLAASFILLGIILGYFDVRNINLGSVRGVFLLIAIIFLVASILIASYGLKKLRDNGDSGTWEFSLTNLNFRLQTWLTYLAVLLFIIVFLIPPGPTPQEKQLIELNKNIKTLISLDSARNRTEMKTILNRDSAIHSTRPQAKQKGSVKDQAPDK